MANDLLKFGVFVRILGGLIRALLNPGCKKHAERWCKMPARLIEKT